MFTVVPLFSAAQDKAFESLEGEQLQPYMDAIELEGNAAQPMEEGGAEEEKVRDPPCALRWSPVAAVEHASCTEGRARDMRLLPLLLVPIFFAGAVALALAARRAVGAEALLLRYSVVRHELASVETKLSLLSAIHQGLPTPFRP